MLPDSLIDHSGEKFFSFFRSHDAKIFSGIVKIVFTGIAGRRSVSQDHHPERNIGVLPAELLAVKSILFHLVMQKLTRNAQIPGCLGNISAPFSQGSANEFLLPG